MIRIQLPPTPSVTKFQRPAFGDGRLYLSTSNGYIQCLGESRINAYVSKTGCSFADSWSKDLRSRYH